MRRLMKVLHLSSDLGGGAARAALRLHRALLHNGVESELLVKAKHTDEQGVCGPERRIGRLWSDICGLVDAIPIKLQRPYDLAPRSVAWYGSLKAGEIDRRRADFVHIHWCYDGFLSIEQLSKITSPLIWNLHDMWAFCGAEHLAPDSPNARWRTGYTASNRNPAAGGIDIDRWTWERKRTHLRQPIQLVAPSRWLADCAAQSFLMTGWPVAVVPNALDVEAYRPIPKSVARQILALPEQVPLVLFGAIHGTRVPHKGWDLLQPALAKVAKKFPDAECMVFGQHEPEDRPVTQMPVRWFGRLHDDVSLNLLYSAADVMVVPSRQEAFGQTASEAQACGCPVVAFRATGLMDVVEHRLTGYLAEPFSVDDLAEGIAWVLSNSAIRAQLSLAARERAVRLWSYSAISSAYRELYKKLSGASLG